MEKSILLRILEGAGVVSNIFEEALGNERLNYTMNAQWAKALHVSALGLLGSRPQVTVPAPRGSGLGKRARRKDAVPPSRLPYLSPPPVPVTGKSRLGLPRRAEPYRHASYSTFT